VLPSLGCRGAVSVRFCGRCVVFDLLWEWELVVGVGSFRWFGWWVHRDVVDGFVGEAGVAVGLVRVWVRRVGWVAF
jgi:hypothetical protein